MKYGRLLKQLKKWYTQRKIKDITIVPSKVGDKVTGYKITIIVDITVK